MRWTIIRAPGKRLAKLYREGESVPYDRPFLVSSQECEGAGIRDLAASLAALEGDPEAAIIRGQRRADLAHLPVVRRAKYDDPDRGRAGFEPVSRDWIMVDVDELRTPGGEVVLDDPPRWITWTLGRLPSWLQGVTCVWSWSNSMGLTGDAIKAHIWIALDRAVDDDALRQFATEARRGGVPIDPAVMESCQIHYTAAPQFEGAPDPLAVRGLPRAILVESSRERAVVPEEVWDWTRREQERREEQRQARASAPLRVTGERVRAAYVEAALRGVREQLVSVGVGGGAHQAALGAAGSLANLVEVGWLDERQAWAVLQESPITDVPARDGEIEGVWRWALSRASANPPAPPELRGEGVRRTASAPVLMTRVVDLARDDGGDAPPPDEVAPPGEDPGDEDPGDAGWPDSDAGLGDRLVSRSGWRLRYVGGLGWLVYEPRGVWVRDSDALGVHRLALASARALRAEVQEALPGPLDEMPTEEAKRWRARLAFARRAEDVPKLKAAAEVARMDTRLSAEVQDLDRDPWRINTPSWTLDLSQSVARDHDPADLLTMQTGVGYDHARPGRAWRQFVLDIMDGDEAMAAFLQRAVGYSLTGSTREQCFFLLWGGGNNGKSTFLEVVAAALGDYAQGAQFETFAARSTGGGEIRSDVASLRGARMVTAAEPDAGVKLAEGLIKQLTGGDPVTARHLYQEPITFRPTFKIWLACNDLPLIRGRDGGMWRRVRLIPFLRRWRTDPTHPPEWPEADKTLKERLLRDELPDVLTWAVEGAQTWLRDGLLPPDRVLAATQKYHGEQDTLGMFLDDCCALGPGLHVQAAAVYEEFARWCEGEGLKVWSKPALGTALGAIPGVTPDRVKIGGKQTRIWRGLALVASAP